MLSTLILLSLVPIIFILQMLISQVQYARDCPECFLNDNSVFCNKPDLATQPAALMGNHNLHSGSVHKRKGQYEENSREKRMEIGDRKYR